MRKTVKCGRIWSLVSVLIALLACHALVHSSEYSAQVLSDTPIAYWRFDADITSSVALDDVGDHDATYEGTPELNSPGIGDTDGKSVTLDGVDDLIAVPDAIDVNLNKVLARAVELWFLTTDGDSRQILYEEGSSSRGLSIYVYRDRLYFSAWNLTGSNVWGPVTISTPVEPGVSHHVVLNFDSIADHVEGYLDGVLVGRESGVGVLLGHSGDIGIGAMRQGTRFHDGAASGSTGFHFDGVMDEVAIYPQPLQPLRILQHFNTGKRPAGCPGQPVSLWSDPVPASTTQFVYKPLPIEDYNLNDLGITDFNNDGWQDIFTLNHYGRESLLAGDGQGGFTEVRSSLGLNQNQQYPALEDAADESGPIGPGVFAYWSNRHIVVRADDVGHIAGTLSLYGGAQLWCVENMLVAITEEILPNGLLVQHVSFERVFEGDGGTIAVRPVIRAAPHVVSFKPGGVEAPFFVGAWGVAVNGLSAVLELRDRHGAVWTDFDQDSVTDALMARGGQQGVPELVPGDFRHELLRGIAGGFVDNIVGTGLENIDCGVGQVSAVDVNSDGYVDVYVGCTLDIPNQLWIGSSTGHFTREPGAFGLDSPSAGPYRWFDVDNDADLDLLIGEGPMVVWYRNDGDSFHRSQVSSTLTQSIRALAVHDFDRDGDLDVFVAARKAHELLKWNATQATFDVVDPTSLGLPEGSLAANWVDIDNDGLADLHLAPVGLFRQLPDHTFVSHLLPVVASARAIDVVGQARVSWFDGDNNGFRDLLQSLKPRRATPFSELPKLWETIYLSNTGSSDGHWLQLQLQGSAADPAAVGAKIDLTTALGPYQFVVGQAEGARDSQGHYRVYIGLGADTNPPDITVTWPDGVSETITPPAVDEVLSVAHPSRGS